MTDHPRGVLVDGSRTLCDAPDAPGGDDGTHDEASGRELVHDIEKLRRLTISDARATQDALSSAADQTSSLDSKSVALVRLAAIVAVHGAVASFGAQADAALAAGASTSEIVDTLVAVAPVVGLPCAVAAAPRLALALGYDLEDEL